MIVIYAVIYDAPLDMKLILEVDECLVNCALRRTGKAPDGRRYIILYCLSHHI